MVTIKKLDNGVTVVMEPLSYVGSCALGIWVRTGAVNEEDSNAGISHYIEHMMFKGTGRRTARQIAEDVDNLGGQINAFTGKEATCYYIRMLEENLLPAMDILFDMFTDSRFEKKEMDRERNVIKEEMKMIQDTPDEDAQDTILELVFKGSALGRPIIGTRASLDGIDRDRIRAYMDEEYTRETLAGLKSSSGYLRRELGRNLQLRYTPELQWQADDSITHGAHILDILSKLDIPEDTEDESTDHS